MFKIKNFSIVPKFFILLLDLGATLLALFIAILIQFNVTVKLEINSDEGINISDVLSEMDYNFVSQSDGAEIEDFEIIEHIIIDSK